MARYTTKPTIVVWRRLTEHLFRAKTNMQPLLNLKTTLCVKLDTLGVGV